MAADRYKYFRIEAAELLEQLSRGLLAIEQAGVNEQLITNLLRQAHTLKGAARVVRQIEIADAAHAMEDELLRCQTPGAVPNVPALLELLDQCTRALALLAQHESSYHKREAIRKSSGASPPLQLVRADLRDVDAVREGVSESLAELAQLRADGETLAVCRELVGLVERQVLAPRLSHVGQYEKLLRSTHSTVIEVLMSMQKFERRLNGTLDRAERELAQAHESVEQLRLVSVATIFVGLERAVRDAAAELGKDVRFEATGGDVKLDGHVLDAVSRALIQMVRNAVAHGIDEPGQRLKAGKSLAGSIKIEAKRLGSNVVFSCQDDGKGIDVLRLSKAAGIEPKTGTGFDEASLLDLLLGSGVSTASRVSSVAGRGVGMGIVREAAASVRAKVQLDNRPGRGLTLSLSVPASLTSLTGLLMDSGREVFVVPLSDVRETVRMRPDIVVQSGTSEVHLRLDNGLVPYVALHSVLGRPAPDTALRVAVVVASGNERLAVGVSRLLGSKTQVVHRLPDEVGPTELVSGVMLDALGNPQLVLHARELIAPKRDVSTAVAQPAVRRPILVVDDSVTTRMLQQSILESVGYAVELATSAEQALEMASSTNYALFLVDVEMPGMDGFTFVERTRQDGRLGQVPAILVSSRSQPADLARGEAVGAKAYMVKDRFDQRELLRWIRDIVGY